MPNNPTGEPTQPQDGFRQDPSPEINEARKDPNGLAALIAGQNLELYRRTVEAQDKVAYLKRVDAAVRADLSRGTLSSSSADALRAAQVPLAGLNSAIQRGIRAGRWSLGGPGSTGIIPPEIDHAFSETAADWQRALGVANSALEESVRQAQTALDGYELYADRMQPGEDSFLASFAFPQDTYIGDELAADPAHSARERVFPRLLMRRKVLPHRPWASLPWLDLCDNNLVFVPDGSSLSYAEAIAAAQGIVADQMSKSAPNCLKITWIDALDNGRSAGAFLHLAENDSLIIDGQVWTESGGIEFALRRVVDRMATLERICLKNEFSNLDAYNTRPENAPEAYQVVVVTGYPFGFQESSARLLRQISKNGTRAGICAIIVMDTSMAPIVALSDTVAPSYAQLTDGPGLFNGPHWWSSAFLPLGDFILGYSGQPHARVVTFPQGESIWVPCELWSTTETVQASIISGYTRVSRQLAESGLSPRELDIKRIDPAARTVSLRSAMLRWLHELEVVNQSPPGWDDFLRSDALQRTGISYNFAELAKQASYLCEQGYVVAGSDYLDPTGLSFPRLTSKGGDMALSGNASADDFAANSGNSGAGTTNNYGPVFQGDLNGAQIAWGNHNVTQSQKSVEQVAPGFEELAQAVTRTLAQLPQFGLPAEDAEDASASANEILVEVVSPSPDRSRIRRSLAALRGFLQPVATQAALGAGEGSHDLARTALDNLQGVVF